MTKNEVDFIRKKPFTLGKVVITTGVVDLLDNMDMTNEDITKFLRRHATGDWGDMCCEDKELNDQALVSGYSRLFSSYNTQKGNIWIITEFDHSITTVLMPDEY